MDKFITLLQKVFLFEKAPQRIGLSQFKEVETPVEKKEPSIKNKNVKLSDLLRRDSSIISMSDVNI